MNHISQYLDVSPDSVHLFWKGRVGLFAILKALDVQEDDEVIIPAFTCVVVANAIIYCGAKPIYVDINPSNLQYNPTKLKQAISPKTKVIIAQNTFGIPADYKILKDICSSEGIICIEDATHGLGTRYENQKYPPNFVKASFYSFQWNKPLSAGIGGLVYCSDKALNKNITALNQDLVKPSFKEISLLRLQLLIRPLINHPQIYSWGVALFRMLSKMGIVVGSSQAVEMESTKQPKHFFKGISAVQRKKVNQQIGQLDQLIAKRQQQYSKYDQLFKSLDLYRLKVADKDHSALKFPIFVKDKSTFLKLASKAGIKLGDWMNSPIHPVEQHWENWFYNAGTAPVAEKYAQHILNLQTDLGAKEFKSTLAFIVRNKAQFIPAGPSFLKGVD